MPPPFAADAILEAADAGTKTAVCVTDGIPSHDRMRLKRFLKRYPESRKMRLVGPNCAGLSAPKGRKMGHAGTIISAFGESAQEKVEILSAAGIAVSPNPSAMADTMAAVLARLAA